MHYRICLACLGRKEVASTGFMGMRKCTECDGMGKVIDERKYAQQKDSIHIDEPKEEIEPEEKYEKIKRKYNRKDSPV